MKADALNLVVQWFQVAVPEPTSKNLNTQMGVHFEEVAEMVDALDTDDAFTGSLLLEAANSLKKLSKHLKINDPVIYAYNEDELLDALCDQIVTATGVAHMKGYNLEGAMLEVSSSNWSKFVNGSPIFDVNGKIQKGPNYFKADLTKFVKR